MLDSMGSTDYRPHPVLSRALDVLFTLHAEHEMNCSTAAVRHLASSGVDVYTSVTGMRVLGHVQLLGCARVPVLSGAFDSGVCED